MFIDALYIIIITRRYLAGMLLRAELVAVNLACRRHDARGVVHLQRGAGRRQEAELEAGQHARLVLLRDVGVLQGSVRC